MKHFVENLTADGRVTLTAYLHHVSEEMPQRAVRPAMLVFPGGGYYMVSDRENEPIALSYFAAGYQVFVLKYTLGKEHSFDEALADADSAIARIRTMAEEWNLDPQKIAVCGFSAGGHLAAASGTLAKNRPNAMVLAYPCILDSMSKTLAFPVPSLDKAVDENTPPAFLFHTRDDDVVPIENTLRFADALDRADRPFEMHVFRHGPHGSALAMPETGWTEHNVAKWMPLSIAWLAEIFDFH